VPAARLRPAPALRVTDFDGRTVILEDFRGKPVVVSFFESWCPTCRVEQPDLSKVAAEFAGRVGFLGISYHDTVTANRDYQRRFKVGYPLANDPSGRTWAAWGVPYQPVVVLVDSKGRIAERFDGGTTGGTLSAPTWPGWSASDPGPTLVRLRVPPDTGPLHDRSSVTGGSISMTLEGMIARSRSGGRTMQRNQDG
jgi:peroxiredoxin